MPSNSIASRLGRECGRVMPLSWGGANARALVQAGLTNSKGRGAKIDDFGVELRKSG